RGEGDARAGHTRAGLGDGGAEDGDGEGCHRPTSCRSSAAVYWTRVRWRSRFWPCGALAAHLCHSSQEAAGALAVASAPAQFREETPLQESCGFSAKGKAARAARDRMRLSIGPSFQDAQLGSHVLEPVRHPEAGDGDGDEAEDDHVQEEVATRRKAAPGMQFNQKRL